MVDVGAVAARAYGRGDAAAVAGHGRDGDAAHIKGDLGGEEALLGVGGEGGEEGGGKGEEEGDCGGVSKDAHGPGLVRGGVVRMNVGCGGGGAKAVRMVATVPKVSGRVDNSSRRWYVNCSRQNDNYSLPQAKLPPTSAISHLTRRVEALDACVVRAEGRAATS